MLDSKTKDAIMEWLIKQIEVSSRFRTMDIAKQFSLDDSMVRLFLRQLHKRELIEYSEMGGGYVLCFLTMDLYDFHRYGGFTSVEEKLLKNIEKLDLELSQLKSKFPEKVETFANATSILSTIATAASKIFGHFI